jgi:hypothetical protein
LDSIADPNKSVIQRAAPAGALRQTPIRIGGERQARCRLRKGIFIK